MVVVLCMLSHMACLDPVEFNVSTDFSDSLVIQGRIIKGDPSFIEVSIKNLFDFSAESRQPIDVRRVEIRDDMGRTMEISPFTPGSYFQELDASAPLLAEVGRSYQIVVERSNGDIIESSLELLPPNVPPRELNIGNVERVFMDRITGDISSEELVSLSIDTEVDIENDGGLLWDVRSRFRVTDSGLFDGTIRQCYLDRKTSVNDILVLDPDIFSSGVINDVELLSIPISSLFFEGYYFEVKQYGLTPTAFAYWRGVDILSEREGQPFDVPVGEVQTNLINTSNPNREVFGYFYSAEEQIIRKRIEREFFEGVLPHCPQPRAECQIEGVIVPVGCRCGLCCDCRDEPRSTEIKPDFFEGFD